MDGGPVRLLLCGDVMLGRGVDRILPWPGESGLREESVRDALGYVTAAEAVNGPIGWPVDFAWPWGEALGLIEAAGVDVRVLNLETAVTLGGDFAPGKAVHYRMNPANLPCLAAVRPDVCVLANNHVLDFGRRGLADTLDALDAAGLVAVGAGVDLAAARRPAPVPLAGGGRVVVLALGTASSGIPPGWAAEAGRGGVHLVSEASAADAARVVEQVRRVRRPGDVVVVSVHWGSNWGYRVPRAQVRFAHALVDGGVDVVHGHSSHHPRPIEVYRGRPVLYGCGDLVDDYEGIRGYEEYRDDLRLLYLVTVERGTGALSDVRMVPLRARRMRLWRAPEEDRAWLRAVLDRVGRDFGTRVDAAADGTLALRWG